MKSSDFYWILAESTSFEPFCVKNEDRFGSALQGWGGKWESHARLQYEWYVAVNTGLVLPLSLWKSKTLQTHSFVARKKWRRFDESKIKRKCPVTNHSTWLAHHVLPVNSILVTGYHGFRHSHYQQLCDTSAARLHPSFTVTHRLLRCVFALS